MFFEHQISIFLNISYIISEGSGSHTLPHLPLVSQADSPVPLVEPNVATFQGNQPTSLNVVLIRNYLPA